MVQTTSCLSSLCAEVGLPRYLVGRAIFEAASLDQAVPRRRRIELEV